MSSISRAFKKDFTFRLNLNAFINGVLPFRQWKLLDDLSAKYLPTVSEVIRNSLNPDVLLFINREFLEPWENHEIANSLISKEHVYGVKGNVIS
jgi:hypothetical protein